MKKLEHGNTSQVYDMLDRCLHVKHGYVTEHAAYLRVHLNDFLRYKRDAEKEAAWQDVDFEYSSLASYLSDNDLG